MEVDDNRDDGRFGDEKLGGVFKENVKLRGRVDELERRLRMDGGILKSYQQESESQLSELQILSQKYKDKIL